ncbi:carbon monoxyde dehydrogenase medium subunit [Actinomadura sp. NBRC 104412]|uniref:FAD binding domain-containing protein n=1 Tax=Actinomadura sp. NBRC 104412 TaxID=3032203 RepID=UPI00249FF3AE|nr:FAD binding domain-containing protein [Actinomadura sp. NBRC 104412]GLZ02754.1 carbon monoxyde dehydrogenase medium subunit [Actinomadura sp. NBRC 104412]
MSEPEFLAPARLSEAAQILAEHGTDARVLGGGTALLPLMRRRIATPRVLLGLHRIPGIAEVNHHFSGLRIGARATLRTLETASAVGGLIPGLGDALARIGVVRIRNQATVGGTLACGDPRLDLPALLAVLDADLRLVSTRGERTIGFGDLYAGDGATAVRPDELIVDVHVPFQPAGSTLVHLKYLPGTEGGYPTVGVAVRLGLDEAGERIADARLALVGAGPATVVAPAAQDALLGARPTGEVFAEAAAAVRDEIAPETDSLGTAEYKRAMAEVFTRRALTEALARVRAT